MQSGSALPHNAHVNRGALRGKAGAMPPIALTVGQFTSSPATVINADGSTNTEISLSVGSGNPLTLRVRLNPNDNREVGVLALAQSAGVNAVASAALPGGTKTAQQLFTVDPAPANQEAVTLGTWSAPSTTVPAWML
jgi:hypothetical protein